MFITAIAAGDLQTAKDRDREREKENSRRRRSEKPKADADADAETETEVSFSIRHMHCKLKSREKWNLKNETRFSMNVSLPLEKKRPFCTFCNSVKV